MKKHITATMLYDYIQCPHRVTLDLFGDPGERDDISPFIKLLWEKGHTFENDVITGLNLPMTDLSRLKAEERETATTEAMVRGDDLIYAGRIREKNLLGIPDLLRKQENGYVPVDIKSGAAMEGGSDLKNGEPKKHYAVQLALYTDILVKKGFLTQKVSYIWDINGIETLYDLEAMEGKRGTQTLWETYRDTLAEVEGIMDKRLQTRPALASPCKLCHWKSKCKKEVRAANDLTLIPELGRSRRDIIFPICETVSKLAHLDLKQITRGKKTDLPGIGINTLRKYQTRAKLLTDPGAVPIVTGPIRLPNEWREIFFDIETDPMRDICYLHGFVIREGKDNSSEKYVAFYADDPTTEAEETAFTDAVAFLRSSRPWAMYYYSKYERTIWRTLQNRYPHVIDSEEIEQLFDRSRSVDLYYDVVKSSTEWPTNDQSIKTLAKYLGFSWRDTDPSGAASIEWYHRWVESKDPETKQRILDYNEDDCRATRILLDGIQSIIT